MKNKHSQAFGLPEAILLTVLVAIAVALLLPAFARRKVPRASRINCVNNEKQLGIAFRGYGIDVGAFPMQVTNQPGVTTGSNN